jgi:hypothetical protein
MLYLVCYPDTELEEAKKKMDRRHCRSVQRKKQKYFSNTATCKREKIKDRRIII